MAAPARRLARAPRRALTEAQILRLVRFPAIRRAISGGLARVAPISVDIPKGGRFIRFRLQDPRRFHPALFATMPLGTRGTLGVIGTKLSAVKRKGELASFIRRMGARLKGGGRKGMIYQLRGAGIIGPSTLQSVLVPRSRVEQIVARFAGSPRLRKVVGNPILATLGLNPLDKSERRMLLRRGRHWDQRGMAEPGGSVRSHLIGRADEARAIARASKIDDLYFTQRHQTRSNPLPGVSKWHMYAGGTAAAPGKHSYAIYTAQGEYHIAPVSSDSGRHRGYRLHFVNSKGKLSGGLWQQLGPRGRREVTGTRGTLHRSPQAAASSASTHHTLHFGAGAKMNGRRRSRRNDESKPMIFSGPEQTSAYRMIALKHALRLELLGMKRRGPSAFAIIKKEFKLKGSKQAVFDQYSKIVEDLVAHRTKPPGFNPRQGRHNPRTCTNSRHKHGRRARRNGPNVVYTCINKRCPKYHVEFEGMAPADYRLATGRSASCSRCGQVLRFLRAATNTGRGVRRNSGQPVIKVPFRDGQQITPARMRAWLKSLPEGQVKRNIVNRFEQGVRQYKRFHLGSEPKSFTYRAVQMGSAGKQITDVDVVVSEGKEWAATYQVPRHSRKYEGKGADGRYIHTHGDESGAKLEVDIKRAASRRLLPERFHTADGKFVGVVPSRNVKITDWYRG